MRLNSLRSFARDWLPPAIIRLVRSVRKSPQNTGAIAFQGDYETWEDAQAASTGWHWFRRMGSEKAHYSRA